MAEGIRAAGRGGIEGRERQPPGPAALRAPDRRPAPGSAGARAHALVLGRSPRRLLRAARLPRRQRPRARYRRAPLRPPSPLGHRAPDQGARPGRLWPGVRDGRRRTGLARADGRASARDPRRRDRHPVAPGLGARDGLRLRVGDRRLLPPPRLRGDGRGRRRRLLRAGGPRLRDRPRLQVRASGAPGTQRRPRALRGDRGGRAAA